MDINIKLNIKNGTSDRIWLSIEPLGEQYWIRSGNTLAVQASVPMAASDFDIDVGEGGISLFELREEPDVFDGDIKLRPWMD